MPCTVYLRWTPHPVIVTIIDNKDHIRVLLYSHYTTITGWGVLLMSTYGNVVLYNARVMQGFRCITNSRGNSGFENHASPFGRPYKKDHYLGVYIRAPLLEETIK